MSDDKIQITTTTNKQTKPNKNQIQIKTNKHKIQITDKDGKIQITL